MHMHLRLRLDHLYTIAALAIGGFVVSLLPIVPNDFWWHMAIGRDIARSGAVPRVDMYSWSVAPATPFFYQSWLSELLFFRVYELGGMPAIVFMRNLLTVLALAVLALGARLRSGSWRLAGLAVAGVTATTVNNLTVRPQTFSWLLFALFSTILIAYRLGHLRRRGLLWLPVLMIPWANLHGAFIIGFILVTLTAIGETARLIGNQAGGEARARVRALWGVTVLVLLATIVNPRGLGVFDYVRKLMTDLPSQDLIVEWQPVSITSLVGLCFAATLITSIALWLRERSAPNVTDLLIWAALLWLAVGGVRYVLWFAMFGWPLIAGLLGKSHNRPAERRRRPEPMRMVNTVLAGALLLLPLSVQPPWKALWSLPPVFAGLGSSVPDGAYMSPSTPMQAVDWLREHPLPPDARLFNDLAFGSYIIWALPETQVYVDPRIELFPLDEWLRYKRITAACRYNDELSGLGVTHLMLSRTAEDQMIAALETDRSWQQIYADPQVIIYARAAAGGVDESCNAL